MKKTVLGIILTALVMTMSSCVSTTCEPSKKSQTLTIGRIIVKIRSLSAAKGWSELNGDQKNNVEIQVRDLDTDKKFTLNTDKAGLLITNKFIPGNTYEITAFSYNKNFATGNWALIDYPLQVTPDIYIEEGYVNPWVDLTIEIWPTEDGNNVRYNYKWNNYTLSEVADDFRAKYPKSKWLNYPFAETPEYSDD